jgi:hypothetical protein
MASIADIFTGALPSRPASREELRQIIDLKHVDAVWVPKGDAAMSAQTAYIRMFWLETPGLFIMYELEPDGHEGWYEWSPPATKDAGDPVTAWCPMIRRKINAEGYVRLFEVEDDTDPSDGRHDPDGQQWHGH